MKKKRKKQILSGSGALLLLLSQMQGTVIAVTQDKPPEQVNQVETPKAETEAKDEPAKVAEVPKEEKPEVPQIVEEEKAPEQTQLHPIQPVEEKKVEPRRQARALAGPQLRSSTSDFINLVNNSSTSPQKLYDSYINSILHSIHLQTLGSEVGDFITIEIPLPRHYEYIVDGTPGMITGRSKWFAAGSTIGSPNIGNEIIINPIYDKNLFEIEDVSDPYTLHKAGEAGITQSVGRLLYPHTYKMRIKRIAEGKNNQSIKMTGQMKWKTNAHYRAGGATDGAYLPVPYDFIPIEVTESLPEEILGFKTGLRTVILKYGNEEGDYDLKKFVDMVDANGQPTDNYTVYLNNQSFPDSFNANSNLKDSTIPLQVTNNSLTVPSRDILNIPIKYVLDNSINLLGSTDNRIATFSLNDSTKNIKATYYNWGGNSTASINSSSDSSIYYDFSYWKMNGRGESLNIASSSTPSTLNSPNHEFSASGKDLVKKLNDFNGTGNRNLEVSPGDVVKVYHKESGHKLQNYLSNSNDKSQGDSPYKEMLYEITTDGFKPLGLNHLTIPKQKFDITVGSPDEAKLLDTISKSIALAANQKVVEFKEVPNTTQLTSSKKAVITIQETLSDGTATAKWDYEFEYEVLNPIKATAQKTVLKYGNKKSDYESQIKNFVEVRDSLDNIIPETDYNATFISFPDSLDGDGAIARVAVEMKTDGRTAEVDVPVTYEYGNSINLKGQGVTGGELRRIATFSLDDKAENITATYDKNSAGSNIHNYFAGVPYYSFSHYLNNSISTSPINEQTDPLIFSAKGDQRIDVLNGFDGDRIRGVHSGDVVKIYHREAGNRFINYTNSQPSLGITRNTVYFEITQSGFKELLGDHLPINAEEISPKLEEKTFIDGLKTGKYLGLESYLTSNKKIRITGFISNKPYSEMIEAGEITGEISIEEDLETQNNSTSTVNWSKDVTFKVKFDNTVPISPEPSDPNMWINVTLPTSMEFHTTESDPTKIVGASGTIVNHSGRPVKVRVSNFTNISGGKPDLTDITSLVLIGASNVKLNDFTPSTSNNIVVANLGSVGDNPSYYPLSTDMKISGTIDKNISKATKHGYKLELTFKPLNLDGTE